MKDFADINAKLDELKVITREEAAPVQVAHSNGHVGKPAPAHVAKAALAALHRSAPKAKVGKPAAGVSIDLGGESDDSNFERYESKPAHASQRRQRPAGAH